MAVVQQNQQDKNLSDQNQLGMPSDGSMQSQQPQQQSPTQVSTGQSATIQAGAPAQQPQQQQAPQPQGQQSQAPKLGQGTAPQPQPQRNQPNFSRFQTLQKYITQNQGLAGDRLQQTAADNVGSRAEGFRSAIDQGQQQTFGTLLSEQQRTGQEAQDQELFQQAQEGLRDPNEFTPDYAFGDISQQAQDDVIGLAQDQQNMGRFEQLRDKIVNRAQIDEQAIQGGLQSLNQMRNLKEDAGDRANLLRQTFSEDPQQYSQSARNLDSFLLEQDRGFLTNLQQQVEDTITSETPKVDELYNLRDMVNQQIEQMGEGASTEIKAQLEGQRGAIDEALRQRATERADTLTQKQNEIVQKMQFGIPLTDEETQFINLGEEDFQALNQLMQERDPSKMLNVGAKIRGFDGQEYLAFDDRFDQLQEMGLIGDIDDFTANQIVQQTPIGQAVQSLDSGINATQGFNPTTGSYGTNYQIQDTNQVLKGLSDFESVTGQNALEKLFEQKLKNDGPKNYDRFNPIAVSQAKFVTDKLNRDFQNIVNAGGLNSPEFFDFFNANDIASFNQDIKRDAVLEETQKQEILNRASGIDLSNLGLGGVVDRFSGTAFDNDVIRNVGNQKGAVQSLLQVAAPKYDLSQFLRGVSADDIYSGSVAQGQEVDEFNTLNRLLLGGEDLRQEDAVKLGFDREGLTQQYLPQDFQPSAIGGQGGGDGFNATGSDFLMGVFSPKGLEATGQIAGDIIGNATQNPLSVLAAMGTGGILPIAQTATKVTSNTLNEMDSVLNKAGLGVLADGTIRPLKEINRTISGALGGVGEALSSGWGSLKKIFSDESLKEDVKDGNKAVEKAMDEMEEIKQLLQKAG